MDIYAIQVKTELKRWEQELLKPPGFLQRTSKNLSVKVNNLIPAIVHAAITASVKGIVKSALAGAEYLPKKEVAVGLFLQERDAIDFRKMLQMIPGIDAVIGAWDNYGLQEELGITGMNAYRMRILKLEKQPLE